MSMSLKKMNFVLGFRSLILLCIAFRGILCLVVSNANANTASQPPNIVFILADDLGWDDVGFHGSEIKTPNIDRLAKEGIILNNYYVSPVCTPTRGSILTGRYPIHTGLQHGVPMGTEAYGLPLNFTTLPQALKQYGYVSHAVGKWHLGFCSDAYLPENRGFESFFGYYNGNSDYLDHHFEFGEQKPFGCSSPDKATKQQYKLPASMVKPNYLQLANKIKTRLLGVPAKRKAVLGTPRPAKKRKNTMVGLDFHYQQQAMWNYSEVYSTEIYTSRAKSIIESHDKSTPLFLYLPHQAVHAATQNDVIQAPQKYINRFPYITNIPRKYFAGAVSALDDSVGNVYQSLVDAGIADNTVIIFSTDNGGPTNGRERNAACNWPLRGSKVTLWQGGVRGVGFIHSPLLHTAGYVSDILMHATDWFPTILSLASKNSSPTNNYENRNEDIDGIDQWSALSFNLSTKRKEVLLNIDPIEKSEAIIVGDFKLTKGEIEGGKYDGWYPPPAHENPQNQSPAGQECSEFPCEKKWKEVPKVIKTERFLSQDIVKLTIEGKSYGVTETDLDKLIDWMNAKYTELDLNLHSASERAQDYPSLIETSETDRIVKVKCGPKPVNASTNCNLRKEACLFNIKTDPCEFMNLIHLLPDVVAELEKRMNFYRESMVPPANKRADPNGDPAKHGDVWVPWL